MNNKWRLKRENKNIFYLREIEEEERKREMKMKHIIFLLNG